ncbi:hypothetical protein DTL42_17620 [Bremerella cremea]|uniref:Uncharacterized protein n=1 Tax=Bremerella cremea TaxID=1031537 RepID=A0A368KRZ2_9BACT|nr:hypothetical protein DTL42_17620 [Bremerella cremea]
MDAAVTTFLVMGIGILISILGAAWLNMPFERDKGVVLLGLGTVLIVGQYVGITRRNRVCLAIANGILIAIVLLFVLLTIAYPPLFFLFAAITATILKMNWHHRTAILHQEQAGVPNPASTRMTLRELLGAFVILALILGPAQILSRMLDR